MARSLAWLVRMVITGSARRMMPPRRAAGMVSSMLVSALDSRIYGLLLVLTPSVSYLAFNRLFLSKLFLLQAENGKF